MASLQVKALAKINWRLAVCGRRPDNYHLLASLFQQINLADNITLSEAASDSCLCNPPLLPAKGAQSMPNLALRAWQLLKAELGLKQSLAIAIQKTIPEGAGLGGGSADAAAVLLGAKSLLGLDISAADLAAIGLKLGADIPFCLLGGVAKVSGIGEILQPLANFRQPLLLLNPQIAIPTPQIFGLFKAQNQPFSDFEQEQIALDQLYIALAKGDYPHLKGLLKNDLQALVLKEYPQLKPLIDLADSLGLPVIMSGSGASIIIPLMADFTAKEHQLGLSPQSRAIEQLRQAAAWSIITETVN